MGFSRLAWVGLGILLSTFGFGQKVTKLRVGDPAPPFRPEATVKGEPFKGFQKGRIYVVHFWASWCRICQKSMLPVSQIMDRYRRESNDVTFISINVQDYKSASGKLETREQHRNRLASWVQKQGNSIRYPVFLDDAKGTINKAWLEPSACEPIPQAFIIDKEGRIAWNGYSAQISNPLVKTIQGRIDPWLAAEDRKSGLRGQADNVLMQEDFVAAGKAGDMALFDNLVKLQRKRSSPLPAADYGARIVTRVNQPFTIKVVKRYMNTPGKSSPVGIDGESVCLIAEVLVRFADGLDITNSALALSRQAANAALKKNEFRTIQVHLRVLMNSGNQTEAQGWIPKVEAAFAKISPEARKKSGVTVRALRDFVNGRTP